MFSSPKRPGQLWVSAALFPGLKRWGREADHSPASSARNLRGAVGLIAACTGTASTLLSYLILTLNPLTWKIRSAPNNASRWQMGFNSAFKGLNQSVKA